MFIKIGKSWAFNADHIRCFGLSRDGKDIIVEYAEGGSDIVEIGDSKEAREIFNNLNDAIGALPYRPMENLLSPTEGVPDIKTADDGRISTSQMIEAFTNILKED